MIPSCPRLAVFTSRLGGGGAQRSMVNLVQGMAARGLVVDLVVLRAQGHLQSEVPDAVRVVDLAAPRALASLPRLVRYLRRERPVALLSALDYVNIVAVWARGLARTPTRLVVSERNTLSEGTKRAMNLRRRVMPALVRRFYPLADAVVAVSQGVASDLIGSIGLPRERIRVIYNPIVTPGLKQRALESVDHPWVVPGSPPLVLAVGRLRPQKDFPTLLRAFAQVRRTRPARLLILGEGPERPALEALIRDLGLGEDVSLPGFVPNPCPFMTRAAAFVLSSAWEGLPGVLIEALYCGAPVVSTDCPSGPREVLKDGRYGKLVPVGDPDALCRGIEEALDGLVVRPAKESWVPFELDSVAAEYARLLLDGC